MIITTTVIVLLTVILIIIINYNHSQVQMNCRGFAVWRFGTRAKRKGQKSLAMPRTCQIGNYALVIALTTGCKAKHHQWLRPITQGHQHHQWRPNKLSEALSEKKSIGGWNFWLTQFRFGAMDPRRDRRIFEESMKIQRRRFHVGCYQKYLYLLHQISKNFTIPSR